MDCGTYRALSSQSTPHSSSSYPPADANNQLLPPDLSRLHLLETFRDCMLQAPVHESMSHTLDLSALQESSELLEILGRNGVVGGRGRVVLEEEPEGLGQALVLT